ncbi:hypothetical protein PP939_gp236 [Rhizobium phage RL38J1]|uniref:Uncharacterized protein n=1 Tax=Rhizobium phage RL38J1 TaxID=2663232 RepID=A0A6B9J345_9CAUD|nr:hypothetical protein PP939_gp236 [Rhizobium phage RL38J1]QGZ13992.1 hypothetical protein RL38J1_236 [Rhizobium phage RL38J1]
MIILSTKNFEILLVKSGEFFDIGPDDLRFVLMEIEDGVRTIKDIVESDNYRLLASIIFEHVREEEYEIHGNWNFGRAATPVTKIQKILEQFKQMEEI